MQPLGLIVGILAVVVICNTPARMTVDGKEQTWFARAVPQPERWLGQTSRLPLARFERGLPWAYQAESGRAFRTKEANTLFLRENLSASTWERVSIPLLLLNALAISVLCSGIVYGLRTLAGLTSKHSMVASADIAR